jgi:hypothetical protein
MDEFECYLREWFPESTDAAVIRNVMMAVALADDMRRNTPWLGSQIGDDLSGNLRRAACMWRIHQACEDGELPFRSSEVPNLTGSSHLLRITSGPFDAHIVRTESSGAFPKDAPIRQDSRLTNERSLFDDPKIIPFEQLVSSVDRAYAWLMFNATPTGALTHVCYGMPKANVNEYLAHFDILRHAMSIGSPIDPSTPPKPDPKDNIKFRRDIEEQIERRKNKNKDKDDKKA